ALRSPRTERGEGSRVFEGRALSAFGIVEVDVDETAGRREASVDGDVLTTHERRLVAREKENEAGDLFRPSETPERRHLPPAVGEAGLGFARRSPPRGLDDSGANTVGANAAGPQALCEL